MDTAVPIPLESHNAEGAPKYNATQSPSVPNSPMPAPVTLNPALPLDLFHANKPSKPGKRALDSFYQQAKEDKDSHQSQLEESTPGNCIVLSIGDVFLPAAVDEVQQSLKAVQRKVQRDGNEEQIQTVENARIHVGKQLQQSLKVLENQQKVRQEEYRLFLQQQEEREIRQRNEESRRQKEAHRRNHPYNKDLWQEVSALMKEMQKLEAEERLWDEALKRLPSQFEATVNNTMKSDEDATAMQVEYTENTPMTEELDATIQMMNDLRLWTDRVRRSVAQIQPAMDNAESLRKKLYRQHQNERFKNYPGIHQPKDLLRILSQDTEAEANP